MKTAIWIFGITVFFYVVYVVTRPAPRMPRSSGTPQVAVTMPEGTIIPGSTATL